MIARWEDFLNKLKIQKDESGLGPPFLWMWSLALSDCGSVAVAYQKGFAQICSDAVQKNILMLEAFFLADECVQHETDSSTQ